MNQAYGNTSLARGLAWVCAFLDVGSLFPIFVPLARWATLSG